MVGDEEQTAENELTLEVDRVRYFYKFKTPEFLEVTEEITMVNNTKETITEITYGLGGFKSALQIIDSDGENLEFHGTENENFHEITIELPPHKGICPKKYRTIRLKYVQYILTKENKVGILINPPFKATGYIFVDPSEKYNFRATIAYSEEYGKKVKTNKSRHFYDAYLPSMDKVGYEEIGLIVQHELPKSFKFWYYSGAYLGSLWPIFVFYALFYNVGMNELTNFDYLIGGLTVVTILILIRSWLFFENMHKNLRAFDNIYLTVIYINIIAVITIMLLMSMQNYINHNPI